jgi:FixJ family two-component response regulator
MSGADLLEHLQASGIPIPAIVLTGRSSVSLRERVERAGALALLEKPAEESDLSREIARALAIASGD